MKLKLLAIALLGLSTVAFGRIADTRPSLTVNRVDSSSVYTVSYSNTKPGKVTLTIKDDHETVLVKRIIKNENGFTMPANFASVMEGIYYVETDNGTEKQTVKVDYNNNMAPTYSRVVDLGDGRYLLSSSHVGVETITIKIYDGNDAVIFNEDKKISGGLSMVFNLKNVVGKPSFEVSESSGHSLMVPGSPVVTIVKVNKSVH